MVFDWFKLIDSATYGANPCKALAELAAAAVASGVGKRKAVAVAPAGGNTAAVRAARPLCIATPRRAARFLHGVFFCLVQLYLRFFFAFRSNSNRHFRFRVYNCFSD